MFSQPELEAVLFARVDEIPRIEVRRGWAVSDLADDGDHVVVRSARWFDARSVRRRLRRRQQHRSVADRDHDG